jgi:hypothetical protein
LPSGEYALADELEEDTFSTEEQACDDEPYSPEYKVDEREVNTNPADPDIETILKRIDDKHLILRPDFQRASVWTDTQKSRLIESLLLNLPIPPCFLAEDEDGTRVVVDGQQRLRSIDDFRHGRFKLTGLQVLKDLNGSKWDTLPPKLDRKILQRVIRTLVISHYSNPAIRFEIFERLNSGGVPLTEQEIRNATLRGSFNAMLERLATSPSFLGAIGLKKPDPRLRHHELILRFFAVRATCKNYKPPLKMILSEFMRVHRHDDQQKIDELIVLFETSQANAFAVFGANLFRRYRVKGQMPSYETSVSKAVFELQMVSLSFIDRASILTHAARILAAFEDISLNNKEFADSLSRATDHRSRFYQRLKIWDEELVKLGLQSELTEILAAVQD